MLYFVTIFSIFHSFKIGIPLSPSEEIYVTSYCYLNPYINITYLLELAFYSNVHLCLYHTTFTYVSFSLCLTFFVVETTMINLFFSLV